MSVRLTTAIRDQLKKAVLVHRFAEDVKKLVADRAAFAEQVYNDIYRKSDRDKMEALPKGWLFEGSSIAVQFGSAGGYSNLDFDGSFSGNVYRLAGLHEEEVTRRILYTHYRGCAKTYAPDHKFSSVYFDINSRIDKLKSAYTVAERQIDAALSSVSTINKLVDVWPEIKPFTDALPARIATLPAIQTSALNALLDLPVAA